MRLPLNRLVQALMMSALLAVLNGCGDDDRKPIPIITVLIHSGVDSYTLNGEQAIMQVLQPWHFLESTSR